MDLDLSLKALSTIPCAAWQVGSSVSGNAVLPGSDIDVLVAVQEESSVLAREWVRGHFRSSFPEMKVTTNDDAVQMLLVDGTTLSMGIYTMSSLSEKLLKYGAGKDIQGEFRTWAIGKWLPESLFGDLLHGRLLIGFGSFSSAIEKMVVDYPGDMRNAICNLCLDEIEIKSTSMQSLRVDQERALERRACLTEALLSSVRYIFSLESVYLRGYKRISQQATCLSGQGRSIIELIGRASFEERPIEEWLPWIEGLTRKGKDYERNK